MSPKKNDISLATPLAPEEVKPGMFVTVHEVVLEQPLLYWCFDVSITMAEKIVRLPWKPCDAGLPYKVKAVCLPYVFAVRHDGAPSTFDLRRQMLVGLTDAYARQVWSAMRSRESGKGRKKDKSRK